MVICYLTLKKSLLVDRKKKKKKRKLKSDESTDACIHCLWRRKWALESIVPANKWVGRWAALISPGRQRLPHTGRRRTTSSMWPVASCFTAPPQKYGIFLTSFPPKKPPSCFYLKTKLSFWDQRLLFLLSRLGLKHKQTSAVVISSCWTQKCLVNSSLEWINTTKLSPSLNSEPVRMFWKEWHSSRQRVDRRLRQI